MKQTILVVEDDPILNQRIRSVLASRWSVESALTAAAARARLDYDHFDLLVLDLHLPDRNGFELLQEIEREGLIGRVIIVTGHGDMAAAIEALRLHSLDFLTKPVDPAELVERVDHALTEDPSIVAPLEAVLGRIRRFLRASKIDGAAAQLEAARHHYPGRPEVVNLLGAVAELRHHPTEAVDLYRQAERLGEKLYEPARRNSERLAYRSWKGGSPGTGIDLGDDEGG